MTLTLDSDATRAYAVLAPAYDLLTAEYAYEPWLTAIERHAREHGLAGHRLLDVGCGTGKSFLPLLERGFAVTACDISPEMVELARHKVGPMAELHVADMRRLPVFGEFDLITCIDDAINHLLTLGEVADALSGMYDNLAPGGILVFDANTLAAYRQIPDVVVEDEDQFAALARRAGRAVRARRRGRGRHRRLHPPGRRSVAPVGEPAAPPPSPDRRAVRARRGGGLRARGRPRSATGRRARRGARRGAPRQGRLHRTTRGGVVMVWRP